MSFPHVILFGLDSWPFIRHCCSLLFKYDSNHLNWIPVIPKRLRILSIKTTWFIESKAFLISRKTIQFSSPLSMLLSKSSHNCINADRVECLGLNPDWNSDNSELSEKVPVKLSKNLSFKYFAHSGEYRNWSIVFTFPPIFRFINWNNSRSFPVININASVKG